MKNIVDSVEMKAIDKYTIEKIGIPGVVLMERAALAVANTVKKYIESDTSPPSKSRNKILTVCGIGNNGADGIAAARILYMQGYEIDILLSGNLSKGTELFRQQLSIAQNLGISIDNNIDWNEYTIIIDGIFGIGLNKEVRENQREVIEHINKGNYTVFAVDIPSGLSADTGKPLGIAVKADYTITFGFYKTGQLLYPGPQYTGAVNIADIGFSSHIDHLLSKKRFTYDAVDLDKLPNRTAYSNKGSYGKVLVIAGSVNVSGACYFSAKAAYRSGAGLVKVMTAVENRIILQTQLPEALVVTYENRWEEAITLELLRELEWASVVVIGPGLGLSELSQRLLEIVVKNVNVPLIIDADAITLLAGDISKNGYMDVKERIKYLSGILPAKTILTPHLKELSVLLGCPLKEIKNNLLKAADVCTEQNRIRFIIKDTHTIVAGENKRYINLSGNHGMATGGMGDALTGIIAAFIAQGSEYTEAAELGVYVHGLAGDKASEEKGYYSLIASDVIDMLPKVLKM
ncbi:bifunctional NAD(P)H-hydrate repair enzyme Nnr [Anaerocolumna cellulosilytica]|uniref:Bifunctional NAD(P)H-hydrate repair enzyme n=1 Tax=Anaerocolumna cellulosilytica TaxID=433286 RepID=A0A6S6R8M7_9FIRM|nr:NAD(P)H-hydrate dehydratase [Anaerocolumna cellulosilytica]MBB5197906.1 NAD(P)H-hydrate epimerase [Anaerocolumna cellulosilytica]BCJ95545.1 bifunctional NAD(P)H-hydrate repair enzyme Nnr [Anaerocolumna cellulosilytica]